MSASHQASQQSQEANASKLMHSLKMRSHNEGSEEYEGSDHDNTSGLDSGPEDEDNERSDTARHVEHCLENVKSAGSFACFGANSSFPLPGLEVDGLGSVCQPSSKRDVAALVEKCHKSPFGRETRLMLTRVYGKFGSWMQATPAS